MSLMLTHAAVACACGVFAVELPFGHAEAWRNLQRAPQSGSVPPGNAQEGYLADDGEFYSKWAALPIALAAGQVTEPPGDGEPLEVAHMRRSGIPPEALR